jgi:hypothetical protein
LPEHWREADYWLSLWYRWSWQRRVSPRAKLALVVAALLLLGVGGWFAADRLTPANAGNASLDSFVLETTVNKIVTVRERGKVVRKVVPVVKKVYLPRQTELVLRTQYEKRVVTTPGTVHIVRRLVTTYVPVLKKQLVTVNGKTRTVVRRQLVPTTRVETQIQTQTQTQTRVAVTTNQQTVVNQQTLTSTRTNTQTVTLPAKTTTVITPPVTVTGPGETVTVTRPGDTVTVTGPGETVTETVTEPGDTVTVTVTVSGGGGGGGGG